MKLILPVSAALAATILDGLVLYPVVYLIFDNFFHLYLFTKPPADEWKNDLIIGIAVVFWFLIASGTGGFVCALLSEKKENFSVLLFLISSFIIALLFTKGAIIREFDEIMLLLFLSFIGGAVSGNILGIRHKKRKAKLKDTAPSQTGTPSQ